MSKKLRTRLDRLRFIGFFTAREAQEKEMRLATGREGELCIYWLVDESDGIIADAVFQVIGPTPLIIAAEIACELALRKTYDQASRISIDLIEQQLRDRKEVPALPPTARAYLLQVTNAIARAVHQCADIPFAAVYDETPLAQGALTTEQIAEWDTMTPQVQKEITASLIDREVRPYVELDAGGVTVLEILASREVRIAYSGSCTSCPSSQGSTLTAIQQILRAKIHPELKLVPV